jgi:hypothetical protein
VDVSPEIQGLMDAFCLQGWECRMNFLQAIRTAARREKFQDGIERQNPYVLLGNNPLIPGTTIVEEIARQP